LFSERGREDFLNLEGGVDEGWEIMIHNLERETPK